MLDLLLRRLEHAAAVLDQELPALVADQAFLEPDLAALDVAEDLFQLGEGFFEVLRDGLRFLGQGVFIL